MLMLRQQLKQAQVMKMREKQEDECIASLIDSLQQNTPICNREALRYRGQICVRNSVISLIYVIKSIWCRMQKKIMPDSHCTELHLLEVTFKLESRKGVYSTTYVVSACADCCTYQNMHCSLEKKQMRI
jgi:hypothetical protein